MVDDGKNLAVVDDSEIIDNLAMALVDEVVSAEGMSPGAVAIGHRLGIVNDRLDEFIAAARVRLAARAMFDQDIQRADAITHLRSVIRRARQMGLSDLADFEPFIKGNQSLTELRDSGLDTSLAKDCEEKTNTKLDADGQPEYTEVTRKIRLHSPLEALKIETRARGELSKLIALHRGAYDPPPAVEVDGEVIDVEFTDRPRDPAAVELFDAIDKHLEPLKLDLSSDATYIDVIAAAAKEVKSLRRAAKAKKKKATKKKATKKKTTKKTKKSTKNKTKKGKK